MPVFEKTPSTAKPYTCLIVEDDDAFSSMAATVVRDNGGSPLVCSSLNAAHQAIQGRNYDLVLLDNHLQDGLGYDFFQTLCRRSPESLVIMITGVPDLAQAVALTRNGLFDYLTKPVAMDALSACLQRARLRLQVPSPRANATEWFGESPLMRALNDQLKQAARHPASTVLFIGETGTGKDLAARMLHSLTFPRPDAPYIPVNCGAVPAEMFEAELFGAERGAYTGADKRRAGLVSAACSGSLFLDEIAEVPLALQAKLLRLLEGREFRPLGSTVSQTFTGRFIAATNKSLPDEVQAGRFREDLLYRLDVFTITLPSLRQRRSDLPGLSELLLTDLARKYQRTKPLIAAPDLATLAEHDFPGNIRELRNVLERSLLKTPEESRWLVLDANWRRQRPAPSTPLPASVTPAPSSPASAVPHPPPERALAPLERHEYQLIGDALRECRGGIRRAAGKLGISPQALLRRLEKWPELRPPPTP